MKQLSLFDEKELKKIISESALTKKFICEYDSMSLNFPLEGSQGNNLVHFKEILFNRKKYSKNSKVDYMLIKSIYEYFNINQEKEELYHNQIISMYKAIKKNLKKIGGINKKNLNIWRKANNLSSFGMKQYSLLRDYSENILEMTKDDRRRAINYVRGIERKKKNQKN